MARHAPSFNVLDKAYWAFVNQHCPHPAQSRLRYTWVRANLSFEHDGVYYVRRSATIPAEQSPSGKAGYAVSYSGDDGSLIRDSQASHSLVGA